MKKTHNYFLALVALLLSIPGFSQDLELIYHWEDTSLPGTIAFNNIYNEIWGVVQDGREYAIIGSTNGTHIFDVTENENISQVAFVEGKAQGTAIIHRDYHDYNGYLYAVADEGQSSLQVIDMSGLPESVEVVYDSDEHFTRAHNIFIDTSSAILYTISQKDPAVMVGLYSLEDPASPTYLNDMGNGESHDAGIFDGIMYLNKGSEGLVIYDVSDPMDIISVGSLTNYEAFGQGYNHSGWISPDAKTYAMCDETKGVAVKLVDVEDFNDVEVITTLERVDDAQSMPHNAMFRGDYLLVSYYHDGLVIYDASDPSNPEKVASYDTFTPDTYASFQGAWGIYSALPSGKILVSDMQTGLYVLGTDLFDDAVVGIEDEQVNGSLQFVPESRSFLVDAFSSDDVEWSLVNLNGQQLYSGSASLDSGHGQIRIPAHLPTGLYVMQLNARDASIQQKFILR